MNSVIIVIVTKVSSNGLLSFRTPYLAFPPRPFDRDFSEFSDAIIAPLWAGFRTTRFGSIFYRFTDNDTVLERVAEVISSRNSNYSNYQPTLAIIVTWLSLQSTLEPTLTVRYS